MTGDNNLGARLRALATELADRIDATDLTGIDWTIQPLQGPETEFQRVPVQEIRHALDSVTAELRAYATHGTHPTVPTRRMLQAADLETRPGWGVHATPLGGSLRMTCWYWGRALDAYLVGDHTTAAAELAGAEIASEIPPGRKITSDNHRQVEAARRRAAG